MSRAIGFAAWTSGVVNAHRVAKRVDTDLDSADGKRRFIYRWSQGVFPLFGVALETEGRAPEGLGPYVVVANHRSPLDILLCVHLVGGVVLSHDGVKRIPVIGDAAEYTDTIFVDRKDERSGATAIRALRRALKENRNIIVFPEGSTFQGDEVRPFKRGAFAAARGLDVTVVPLGIAYEPGAEFKNESFREHLLRMCARPRTPVQVTIGEPRGVPKTDADAESLRVEVQALVDRSAARRDKLR
ncbi:MAG: lysophospholipid acyltransferase family protein [Sandaracinaceae bacterium]